MTNTKTPFYHRLELKMYELIKHGKFRKSKQEVLSNGTFETVESKTPTFFLTGDFVICSADLYNGLTPAAIKLVLRIQKELVMNNPLWELEHNGANQGALRSPLRLLKEKDIIEAVVGTSLFIVNPAKIRKGGALTGYATLLERTLKGLRKNADWKPSKKDIIALQASKQVKLSINHLYDFSLGIPES